MKFHSTAQLIPPPENTAEIDAALAAIYELAANNGQMDAVVKRTKSGFVLDRGFLEPGFADAAEVLANDFSRRINGELDPSYFRIEVISAQNMDESTSSDEPHTDEPFAFCSYTNRPFVVVEGDFEFDCPTIDALSYEAAVKMLPRHDFEIRDAALVACKLGKAKRVLVPAKTVAICDFTTVHNRGEFVAGDFRIYARTPF